MRSKLCLKRPHTCTGCIPEKVYNVPTDKEIDVDMLNIEECRRLAKTLLKSNRILLGFKYLIDNQFTIDQFIDDLKAENFHLFFKLDKNDESSNTETILSALNSIQ